MATTRIAPAYNSIPLTLLSWNISKAQPSNSAPNQILRSQESSRLIRLECLDASRQPRPSLRPSPSQQSSSSSSNLPDIIALQECPYPSWGDEEFGSSGYISMGTQSSHCGYVDLLLKEELARRSRPIVSRRGNLPSVATTIILPNRTRIAVSSSHLAPFKEGSSTRAMQCETLMKIMTEECDNCILLGDFNMRAFEDKTTENLCGGEWIDAWKGCGSNVGVKFTWDSFANRYHNEGFSFKARFDRCYLRGDAFGLNYFSFMGNRPVKAQDGGGGAGDYLSDHFGMVVGMDVSASPVID